MINLEDLSFDIFTQDDFLTGIDIYYSKEDFSKDYSSLEENIYEELYEYLNRERKCFDIKLNPKGTDFEKRVFREIYNIPYGKVITYKDIAIKLGNVNLSRAVGNACGKNPIPIIIPCHRVIGSRGNLGGYKLGIDLKRELLKLEKEGLDERI